MNWFLKKAADNTVYGPVDDKTLEAWAADGRIAPDDLISTDRRIWKPAPELPVLGMEWLIQMAGGGQYGPLHVMALKTLVREEGLSPEALVSSARTGTTASVAAVLLPLLIAQESPPAPAADPELVAKLGQAQKAAAEAEARAGQAAAETKTLQEKLAQAAQEIEKAQQQVAAREKQLAEWKGRAEQAQDQIQTILAQLKAEQEKNRAAQEGAEQARADLEKLRAEVARQASALKALEEQLSQARHDVERTAQMEKDLAKHHSALQQQAQDLQEARREQAALRAELEKWKALHQQAVADAEKLRACLNAKPPTDPSVVPLADYKAAQQRIAHLERNYKQAMLTLHRNLAARVGETPSPPPEMLHRRDIA